MSSVTTSEPNPLEASAQPQGIAGLSWLALSAVVVGLDQWTKAIAVRELVLYQPIAFVDGFWNWMLARNYGVAFSLFDDHAGWQRYGLSLFAIVIVIAFVIWLTRVPRRDVGSSIALALVIGGAVGNVIDRMRFGYVVDFIDWHVGGHHWPAFNIADSSIVCGAILLVLMGMRDSRRAPA